MKINYNLTGKDRKALVAAVYLFAPSFAFEIGGYHVDKSGVLSDPDNIELFVIISQINWKLR